MEQQEKKSWQEKLHTIVYESSAPAGKAFDVTLLFLILTSILVVMLDSIQSLHDRYGQIFLWLEWGYTILFTIEFLIRLICIKRPLNFIFSFFGIIDILSIIPTYIGLF